MIRAKISNKSGILINISNLSQCVIFVRIRRAYMRMNCVKIVFLLFEERNKPLGPAGGPASLACAVNYEARPA